MAESHTCWTVVNLRHDFLELQILCFTKELHTLLAFSFHLNSPVWLLCVWSPPHNAVLLLLSHMPIPSERFSSVPQFTGRMRLGICPPEHQGKATIPEMSSSLSLLVSLASPHTHPAPSFHYNDPSLRPSRLQGSVDDYRSHLFPNGC